MNVSPPHDPHFLWRVKKFRRENGEKENGGKVPCSVMHGFIDGDHFSLYILFFPLFRTTVFYLLCLHIQWTLLSAFVSTKILRTCLYIHIFYHLNFLFIFFIITVWCIVHQELGKVTLQQQMKQLSFNAQQVLFGRLYQHLSLSQSFAKVFFLAYRAWNDSHFLHYIFIIP